MLARSQLRSGINRILYKRYLPLTGVSFITGLVSRPCILRDAWAVSHTVVVFDGSNSVAYVYGLCWLISNRVSHVLSLGWITIAMKHARYCSAMAGINL